MPRGSYVLSPQQSWIYPKRDGYQRRQLLDWLRSTACSICVYKICYILRSEESDYWKLKLWVPLERKVVVSMLEWNVKFHESWKIEHNLYTLFSTKHECLVNSVWFISQFIEYELLELQVSQEVTIPLSNLPQESVCACHKPLVCCESARWCVTTLCWQGKEF